MVIVVYNLRSIDISAIVGELKDRGLVVGVDFDFEYQSGRYDVLSDTHIPRQTKFTFHNEREGTLFALKWL